MTNHSAPDDYRDLRGPTARDIIAPIFRHKRAGILTAIAMFAVLAPVVLLSPVEYEAQMKILVKRERLDPIVSADPNLTQQSRADVTEDELNSEVELLKSRDLLEQVVVAAGLSGADTISAGGKTATASERTAVSRAVRELQKDMSVTLIRRTTLIKVSYRSPDPTQAARVLTELERLYLEKHLVLHRPPGAYQFFTDQAERSQAELTAAETRLKEYGRQESVVSADVEKANTLQKLADFEAALQQTRATIEEANRQVAELEAQTAATPARHTTQIRTLENTELIRQLKSKILDLEVRQTEMLRKFTPNYPPVVQVEQELAQARAALERTEGSPLTEGTTDQNPTYQWLQSELARVRTQRAAAIARSAALTDSIRVYRERARQLDEKGAVQQDLRRAMNSAEEKYLLYQRKQEEARISDALDHTRIANVAVAEEPTAPALPSSIKKSWILILGAIMSLMLGVAVTYLLNYFSPHLRTPDEVERALEIPVLVSLRSGR
jgi:uncharacterized protein involved in exopolysaccharide biosynthesis